MIPRFRTAILFSSVFALFGISSSPGYSSQSPYLSDVRKQIMLNGEWSFKIRGDEEWQKIDLPASTEKTGTLFFRRSFKLPPDVLESNFILVFEGINFSSRIKLNGQFISAQAHGFTLVSVPVPNELIRREGDNLLEVEVETKLHKRTIPIDHALFSPVPLRGIFRDIYLVAIPPISIHSVEINPALSNGFSDARVTGRVRFTVDNVRIQNLLSDRNDSLLTIKYAVHEQGPGRRLVGSQEQTVNLSNVTQALSFNLQWQNPKLWSPKDPNRYVLETSILFQGEIIDLVPASFGTKDLSFVDHKVQLNGAVVPIQGVGFLEDRMRLLDRDNTVKYLEKIKSLGFNTISWFSPPPNHALELADSLGLFSILRIPIWNVPGPILVDEEFQILAGNLLEKLGVLAANHPSVLAISIGEGFDPVSDDTRFFVETLAGSEKRNRSYLLTAGFRDFNSNLTGWDLDFISFNINLHRPSDWKSWQAKWIESGPPRPILFTDLSVLYIAPDPDSENVSVYEARQAYNLKAIINQIQQRSNLGFVLTSLFDWKITYPTTLSISSFDFRVVPFGLSDYNETPRMAMNMMQNVNQGTGYQFKFQPMDPEQFDTLFIIYGLAIIIGFLYFFRREHRFRGNFIRLLSRPMGFYAELKDGRIIPWFVTILVLVPSASSLGIIAASLFSFLRNHSLFDFLISQISPFIFLNKLIVLMTWHPLIGLLGFTLCAGLVFTILAMYVFFLSAFTGHNLSLRNALTFVYWEGCIFVFLLPVAFVSYRLYAIPSIRLVLFLVLIIFGIWYLYRLVVGVRVIFDFKPVLTAILFVGVPLVLLLIIGSIYNQTRGLNAHLTYLFHLWKFGL